MLATFAFWLQVSGSLYMWVLSYFLFKTAFSIHFTCTVPSTWGRTSLSLSKCALFLHIYLYRLAPLGTVYIGTDDRGESNRIGGSGENRGVTWSIGSGWRLTGFAIWQPVLWSNSSAIVAARSALGSFTKCSLGIGVPESYVGFLSGEHWSLAVERVQRGWGYHQPELIELVFWISRDE